MYSDLINQKNFAKNYLPSLLLFEKKLLLDCVSQKLPLFIIENFSQFQKLKRGFRENHFLHFNQAKPKKLNSQDTNDFVYSDFPKQNRFFEDSNDCKSYSGLCKVVFLRFVISQHTIYSKYPHFANILSYQTNWKISLYQKSELKLINILQTRTKGEKCKKLKDSGFRTTTISFKYMHNNPTKSQSTSLPTTSSYTTPMMPFK